MTIKGIIMGILGGILQTLNYEAQMSTHYSFHQCVQNTIISHHTIIIMCMNVGVQQLDKCVVQGGLE